MPLSNYALDTFVSNNLSKLTEANAVPIGLDFPGHARWIATFVLNRIFQARVSEDRAALAFAMLRRAEAAVEDYDAGCAALSDFVGGEKSISTYFRCLRRFEGAVGATYQGFDFARHALATNLFEKGDGSPLQRLNEIYNVGRHQEPLSLPGGALHAVRISNEGVHALSTSVAFKELRDLVGQLARIADSIARGGKDV
jgi:hypothetical protein